MENENLNIRHVRDRNEYFQQDFEEERPAEVVAMSAVLQSFVHKIRERIPRQTLRIRSPYHAQCNLICSMINTRMENETNDELEILKNC